MSDLGSIKGKPATVGANYPLWIGLTLALVAPLLTYLCVSALYGHAQAIARVELGLVLHWINLIALILVVIQLEKQPLSSIGLRPFRWRTLLLGSLAGIAVLATSPLIAKLNSALGFTADKSFAAFMMSLPFWIRALLVVTAGIFEEILFRGYAIERLIQLTGKKWVAALVTLIAFTIAHIPAVGFPHLFPVFVASLLVTLLYLWRRDLVLNIVAHIVIDGIGLLLLPALA